MSNQFIELLYSRHKLQLNAQQQEAINHKRGPALVLAVPGAGKTTVLIARTANLILHHQVAPSHILSLTFSNASAKDMKERFQQLFGHTISQPVPFSTIHRFALGVVRKHFALHRQPYSIIEGDKAPVHKNQLLRQIYQQVNKDFLYDDKLEELSNAISFVKNAMLLPQDFHQLDLEIDHFQDIYTLYEKHKSAKNFIDFDDMLSLALKILQDTPDLLQAYRNFYQYIQVDEAQDTSKIQHKLIHLLAQPRNNLFAVADDDQSIYGFRGAFPEALLNFSKDYPGAKTFYMEQNYRSSQDIVWVSNAFIKSNRERYDKNLFTLNEKNTPITIVHLKDEIQQLDFILEELRKPFDSNSRAVLYRNNISAISLIDQLDRRNIPFNLRGFNMQFFNHWVLHDIIAFLDLALNPCDRLSFERIYYKMNGYIPKAALTYLKQQHPLQAIFDLLISYPEFRNFQKENMMRLRADFIHLSEQKPIDALLFIENELDYKKYLISYCQRRKYSYDSIGQILSYLKMIAAGTSTIIEFLQRLSDLPKLIQNSKYHENRDTVLLSTVHSAKGLEFDQVYMIDLLDGQFPTKNSISLFDEGDNSILEEERRLFYVGMTRAKKELSLCYMDFKDGSLVKPSRFIYEVKACMPLDLFKDPASKIKTFDYSFSKDSHKTFLNSSSKPIEHPFLVGNSVKHQIFGEGTVKSIREDIIQIDFNSVGIRSLSLSVCIDKKILSSFDK